MVAALDDGVKNTTNALKAAGLWDDFLVVFTTDNGGIGPGRNWPLRGRKLTLWEGGTRGVAFVAGTGIPTSLRNTSTRLMIHAVDWYATILRVGSNVSHVANILAHEAGEGTAATASTAAIGPLDALDVWDALSTGAVVSPRDSFVYNIDPVGTSSSSYVSAAVRVGQYKYIVGIGWSSGGTCDPCPDGAQCDPALHPFLPCEPKHEQTGRGMRAAGEDGDVAAAGGYVEYTDDDAVVSYLEPLVAAAAAAAASTPPACNKVAIKTNYRDPNVRPPCSSSGTPGCNNQSDCCALCANEPKCAVGVWSKANASCTLKASAKQPYFCKEHAGLYGGVPSSPKEFVFNIDADPAENVDLSSSPSHAATLLQLRAYLTKQVARMQPALYNVCPNDMDADPALQQGAWVPWGCPKAASPLCGV